VCISDDGYSDGKAASLANHELQAYKKAFTEDAAPAKAFISSGLSPVSLVSARELQPIFTACGDFYCSYFSQAVYNMIE
jgi:hypothetical protein